jgi:MFS-type transporter involved in bile tolerance (Atg22 family)
MKPQISIKAVAIGLIVDFGGSLIAGLVIGIVAYIAFRSTGGKPGDFSGYHLHSYPVMVTSIIVGLVFAMLGGFVSARIAKKDKMANACLVGILSTATGLLLPTSVPLWYSAVSYILTLPSAYMGGAIASRQAPREPSPPI